MSDRPWMPLFVDAYLADTTHLTIEESGVYLHLLMAMWRRDGTVPDDDKDLARICRLSMRRWIAIKERLKEFLVISGGVITQKRLQKEIKHAKDFSKKQSENASKRWSDVKSKNKDLEHAKAMPDECPHTHTYIDTPKEGVSNTSLSILKTTLDDETAEAVVEYRKRNKYSLAPIALRRLANQLAKWPKPNEAAAEMIVRNWRGFDPAWMERGNGRPNGQAPPKRSYADELHRIREDMEREADERENGNRDRAFKAAAASGYGRH